MDIETVNSLIDDYKGLIESYRKENKHLRELQRNMDKQYAKLESNWNELKKHIGSEWYCFDNESVEHQVAKDILTKIQEIESGKND